MVMKLWCLQVLPRLYSIHTVSYNCEKTNHLEVSTSDFFEKKHCHDLVKSVKTNMPKGRVAIVNDFHVLRV